MLRNFRTINFFLFIVLVIFSTIIISIYSLLQPDYYTPKYNFIPFPNINPIDLPNPDMAKNNYCAIHKIIPCNSKDKDSKDCKAVCGENFICADINKESHVIEGKEISNGHRCETTKECINKFGQVSQCYRKNPGDKMGYCTGSFIKGGHACVPAKPKTHTTSCPRDLGRWVWSSGEADNNDISQGWKCEQLYPELSSETAEGGMINTACKNRNTAEKNIQSYETQPGYLYRDDNGKQKQWKPEEDGFEDPRGPYDWDLDEKGNKVPIWKCSCDNVSSPSPTCNNDDGGGACPVYLEMPGVPYKCGRDPCMPHTGYTVSNFKTYTDNKGNDTYTCNPTPDGLTNGLTNQFIHSNLDGVLYPVGL
jgi:hypothetical protein